MESLLETQTLLWLPMGFMALWCLIWRHKKRGEARDTIVTAAGWWGAIIVVAPLALMLSDEEGVGAHYFLFAAGVVLAYLHVRLRSWD